MTTARQLRGLRKNELARKVGLTPAAVSQYELGQSRPSATVVAQLAMALGCLPRSSLRGTRIQRCPALPPSEASGQRRSCNGIKLSRSARSSGGWSRPSSTTWSFPQRHCRAWPCRSNRAGRTSRPWPAMHAMPWVCPAARSPCDPTARSPWAVVLELPAGLCLRRAVVRRPSRGNACRSGTKHPLLPERHPERKPVWPVPSDLGFHCWRGSSSVTVGRH
ncbi:transcriptional regulator [Streptomyces sp. F001]|nr:transcriptional regulator [Streptomyces sp. F001]